MQMPSEVRPQRPLRWLADACEIGSIGSRCTLVPRLYREIRAVPGSMTYLMPGTVSEVSATLVASTTRRVRLEAARRSKTRCCSAADSRRVQREHLESRQRPASSVRGVPDLPLAGQEHQDVAGPLGGQLVDRVADRLAPGQSSSSTGR